MPNLTAVLAAVESIGVALFAAILDGRITADEAAGIHAMALAEFRALADGASVGDVVAWVGDLLQRDPVRMRERADKHEARGHARRADALRERAERVEARRA